MTKYLCYKSTQHCGDHHEPLQIAQHEIEQVSKFKYVGNVQTSDQSVKAEFNNTLVSAWLSLSKLHVWDDDYVSRGSAPLSNLTGDQSSLVLESDWNSADGLEYDVVECKLACFHTCLQTPHICSQKYV